MSTENTLCLDRNILLCVDQGLKNTDSDEIKYIMTCFCGRVFTDTKDINGINLDNVIVYIFGNVEEILNEIENKETKIFYVIKELSYNYDNVLDKVAMIGIGEIPINIHNVGVFFENFFDNTKNYFDLLNREHQFQSLTESNKTGTSYRKGIYLTNVVQNSESIDFNLLRCSTNLDGPTDNFRETDKEIINKVNNIGQYFFEQKIEFNHVLAQVYNNVKINSKEKKAKIKEHSDKTKDMPRNALIAFCTFYKFNTDIKNINDSFTKLRFRLKKCVNDPKLEKRFDIILYPNSVFIMSLTTNRLYTHETVPAYLPIEKLPIRMGYVIRCSNTKAIFKDDKIYIKNNDNSLILLQETSNEKTKELKTLYFKENNSDDIVDYGIVDFSLNKGDYLKPNL